MERAVSGDRYGATVEKGMGLEEGLNLIHRWEIQCFDKDGNLKWEEIIEKNLVTTAGLNKYLDATIKTGLTTPLWYVGLKDTGTPVIADTMASHASWATITPYSDASDPAYTPGTIAGGSVDNSASKAVFNINATDDVYGAFIKDNSAKAGATGTLLCVGNFTAPRSVVNLDTLNVQITLTIS